VKGGQHDDRDGALHGAESRFGSGKESVLHLSRTDYVLMARNIGFYFIGIMFEING
jgi:hypothetical protein